MLRTALTLACLLYTSATVHAQTPVKIGEFGQEMARQYTAADGLPSNESVQLVRAASGGVLVETTGGWAKFENEKWTAVSADAAPKGRAALATEAKELLLDYLANMPIDTRTEALIHEVQTDENGALRMVASNMGLYVLGQSGELAPFLADDKKGRLWGNSEVAAAFLGREWFWICTEAGVVGADADEIAVLTSAEGLPFNTFTCMDQEPTGAQGPWFGTTRGAIRRHNGAFSYRQGKRWLPDDHVNDILAMPDGSAWVATKGGVSHIYFQPMTMAQKAAHYEEQIEKHIKRTEFGYVAEITTDKPGDLSVVHHHDSDNDGLWTSMYGAGECFAYAATKDPKAKERAKAAFEALRFLQKVTQGGEHSPPKGYVARTILPTADGRDPNIGRIEGDREEQKSDALWKVYEPRWPKSADGKWYWKSDTSSDELDGHYFFYPAYYDLVADTEEEKERVREVVRDLTDHFLEHNFQLIDHDGKVTRWGEFSPEALNGDRRWYVERGLNSLSMLSYLAVAEHMTGDPKYAAASKMLIEKHHYAQNAMVAKIQYGIGSGNQSDDEMAFMSFYNLIKYTKNDELRERMRHSFFGYWKLEYPEMNPFFNIAAAASLNDTASNTHWGPVNLSLYEDWLDDSIATLKGFPLDRFDWAVHNSHRIDLVTLYRQQTVDIDDRQPPRRALRVNGKVLPVEERHFNHWNTDPYRLDYGGEGRMLASGTVFLLPYYMGLYHGYIE